jgi:hypothetical protein
MINRIDILDKESMIMVYTSRVPYVKALFAKKTTQTNKNIRTSFERGSIRCNTESAGI